MQPNIISIWNTQSNITEEARPKKQGNQNFIQTDNFPQHVSNQSIQSMEPNKHSSNSLVPPPGLNES